jgi:hypothetical protein
VLKIQPFINTLWFLHLNINPNLGVQPKTFSK